MRSLCSTLLLILVVKEGSSRSTVRRVPRESLDGLEDGRLADVAPGDNPQMPEPPKGLRQDRKISNMEIADAAMLASGLSFGDMPNRRFNPLGGLRRDRRFAPGTEPVVAQMPQVPSMPQMPQMPMPGGGSMPQMPPMPPMPQIPSSRRKRAAHKDDKKGGKGKEESGPEEKKENPEENPGEKKGPPGGMKGKPEGGQEMKGKPPK